VIDDAFYSVITTNAGVSAVMGTRLYPNQAPPNPTEPYATYVAVTDGTVVSLTGASGLGSVTFQVDVWAHDSRDAKSVAELIRIALVDHVGTTAGETITDVMCGQRSDDLDDEGIGAQQGITRISRDYTVWYAQAVPGD